ncbi:MAG: hypothetical protein U1E46_02305 [Hyphomicrobiales bacterium]
MPCRLLIQLLVSLCLALSFAVSSHAASIAGWKIGTTSGNRAAIAASAALTSDKVKANNLLLGTGLNSTGGGTTLASTGWTGEATDYVTFSFSVTPGYALTLDNLYISTRSSPQGPGVLALYSSLDGFRNAIYTFTQPTANGTLNSVVTLGKLPVVTSSVEFRIQQVGTRSVAGGSTAPNGNFRVIDSVASDPTLTGMRITGQIAAVPLPPAVALFGAGLLLLGVSGRHALPDWPARTPRRGAHQAA